MDTAIPAGPPSPGLSPWLTAFRAGARVSRFIGDGFLWLSAAGLIVINGLVAWQVWGRYVLNESPISAEPLAIVVLLYISLLGAAVGVREQFHMSVLAVIDTLPPRARKATVIANHLLVAAFGLGMVWHGGKLSVSTWNHTMPTVGISEAVLYLSIPLSGLAIILFSLEHVGAILLGEEIRVDTFRDGSQ